MSEKWNYVPEFKLSASKRQIIAEINTDSGFEHSAVSLERAAQVAAEIRTLAERLIKDDPITVGWSLEWIAEEIEALVEAGKAAS